MKNIGASKAYMRGPFVIEGIVIGILSSTLSYFALRVTYAYVYKAVNSASDGLRNMLGLAKFSEFSGTVFFMFGAAGIFVGVISGVIAVRRYVKF